MSGILNEICSQYTLPQEVKAMGVYPYYRPIASGQDPVVTMADGSKVLMFGSNSYLGLSDDPRLKEAAVAAIRKYGTSCSGSRFLNGTLDIHEELEAKLAKFVGKDAAVTYSTGFQVNLGVVSCLGFRGGYTFLDALDHACIIDGSRLGFAEIRKFAHNDMDALESKLKLVPSDAPKLIVVDGVYSMEGDIAPVPKMVELCEKYNASLMIDDAHGLGVIGKRLRDRQSLRTHRQGGSHYGHVLQEFRLSGRLHCRRRYRHKLPQAQLKKPYFQRIHDTCRSSSRIKSSGYNARRAGAQRKSVESHASCTESIQRERIRHRTHTVPYHPALCKRYHKSNENRASGIRKEYSSLR